MTRRGPDRYELGRGGALLVALLALGGCVGVGTSDWEPANETCDGFDDDGNGVVDDDGSGAPLRRDCSNACGPGIEECVDGEWRSCTAPQPMVEVCNGVDDDCDGEVDEVCDCVHGATRRCAAAGAGDCGLGLERCEAGEWSECDQLYLPGEVDEVCDGRDNNCDGTVDEGADCPCEMLFRSGRTYLFCAEGDSWEGARDFCRSWGYALVTIETRAENEFVADEAIERVSGHAWWTGLNDLDEEGRFVWEASARPAVYTAWYGDEPNNARGNEDCGVINYGSVGGWNDGACWETRSFVCESP